MMRFLWIVGSIGILALGHSAWAEPCKGASKGKWECVGGGGEIPTPFNAMNRKVELADGELYILYGRIVFGPSIKNPEKTQAYLEVNLDKHPWLANVRRRSAPVYPLDMKGIDWARYEGSTVRMTCEAEGRIETPRGQRPSYYIYLRSVEDPPQIIGRSPGIGDDDER